MYQYNKNNIKLARAMRKNMTPWELKLWNFLKTLPQKFYRQKAIGNYIADFYCCKAKLIIELDGSQHYQDKNIQNDIIRTKFFESLGLVVVRYTNLDIDKNFGVVCEDIYNRVNKMD